MEKRGLKILCWMIVLSCIGQTIMAQLPESGKAYRILNPHYSNVVIGEDFASHKLSCSKQGDDTRYDQMWIFDKNGSNYTIQNVYTGRYIQNQSALYNNFKTSTAASAMFIDENAYASGYYNIKGSSGSGTGMHCDASYAIVPWYPTTSSSIGATEWVFSEITTLTLEDIANARDDYAGKTALIENADSFNTILQEFYTDASCSELKSEYAVMSDEELTAAISGVPTVLREYALKIKNSTWGKREQEFRIHEYQPYSDADSWASRLNIYAYSPLNNPTGIYANSGDILYIFVGDDTPADATLAIEAVTGTSRNGALTTLKKGLNIVAVGVDKSMLFVRYTVNTTGNKVIADFPDIKIHIENGTVNGYFDKSIHTDEDWRDISKNLATHEIIQIKGDKVMYHMHRSYVVSACPTTITDAIGWWDRLTQWEHDLMGIGDVCPSKFNNHMLCTSGPDSYMYATTYHTYYQYETLASILPWSRVYNGAGGCWGPAHEIGHTNQGAINIIGCTEVSNNLFSNMAIFNIGKYTTRGSSVNACFDAYRKGTPYTLRGDVFSMTRMYYQLFLYYHAAKHDTLFYPKLFKLLREDPLVHNYYASGADDQLKFAEKCCEAAGEDLSEFFEAWGFFVPMNNADAGDYSMYKLTVTQSQINLSKERMKKYAKKSGNIMFIEDRVAKSERMDGVSGYRLDYDSDVAIGKMGMVGQWGQYVGDGEKAEGYTYSKSGTNITINAGSGAVGFKVYDSEGNLISMSNTYTITLPDAAVALDLKVVVAQADGTDVELTSTTMGSEEQQLEALTAAIAAAKKYIDMTNAGGVKVGYFYSDAIADLSAVYDSAVAAKKAADQSVRSYGEWSQVLDKEIGNLLLNKDAKISIKTKNYYSLTNANYTSYSIYLSGTSLAMSASTTIKNSDSRKKWQFVPAGEDGMYYIRNKGGNYITSLQQSTTGKAASSSQSDAIKYKVVDNGNGTFYMKGQDEDGQCLHCDGSMNLVGWDSSNKGSHWYITVTENNSGAYELAQLDSLINMATEILNETTDTTSTDAIVILSNVHPNDSLSFVSAIAALYAARNAGKEAYGNKKDYTIEISDLQAAIDAVDGKYNIMPVMPMASSESEVTWYYIKSLSKEMYCTIDTVSTRYLNNIPLADLSRDDKSFWWCFIPTGNENEFYIYNYKTAADVYSTSNGYLKCDGATLGVAYTISLVEDKFGFSVTNGEYSWNATTYAKIAKLATYWTFEKIVTEQNDCLTGIKNRVKEEVGDNVYYDLYGRKTTNPTKKGIYIHNGHKIFVK